MIRSFLLSVFALLTVASPSHAQTVGEALTFKRIGLFEIEDQTQKGLGRKMGELVRGKIEEAYRFEIIRRSETIQWPGQPEEILRLGQATGVDLVVAGKIAWADQSLKLSLGLFEGKTGKPFALEYDRIREWKKPEVLDQAVRGLVRKLTGRIPYKALVTEVQDKRVRFDAGTLHGVEKGLKATVFEITGVERHPFTHELIGFQTEEIAEVIVTEVSERSSVATLFLVQKDKKIQENDKIRFTPSQAALAQAEVLKKELLAKEEQGRVALEAQRLQARPRPAPTAPTDKIRLAVQTGLFNNTFDFDSNELTFARKAKGILTIEIQGDVWFVPSWGLGLAYQQSGIQFDQIDNDPIDANATVSWIRGGMRYRYLLKETENPSAVIAMVGYQFYQFQVSPKDQTFFVDYTLQGPFLGLEGAFPLSNRFGFGSVLEYLPFMDYRERSVDSGTDSKARGYRIKAGGHYRMREKVQVALYYVYEKYMADFSGVGSRGAAGVTDARSEETYKGLNLSLTTVF